ncbi:MAG: NBR1-Ig-like domain-containing protein, partial [Anaerolineae bacterium]
PHPTSQVGGTIACSRASELVDETIPDGTEMQPGAAFNKMWRIKNSGTCDWGAGYVFDLVNGPALGATRLDVPHVPAGSEHEFTLSMTAPTSAGTYRSDWRLFDAQGRPFGKTFFAEIVVPQPACPGPTIKTFAANPTAIAPGQSSTLSWDVDGADTVSITPGAQVTAAANTLLVSPEQTTTYTLQAKKGDCVASAQVTVTVGGPSCQGLAINRFEADPPTIAPGQSSTLRWEVTGASRVSITPAPQVSADASTLVVSPGQTTIYTLEAANAVCTLTKQATVTVTDAETLLDFVAGAPAATWQTEAGSLVWPGSPADAAGYARWLDAVTLQNGHSAARVLDVRPTGQSAVWGRYAANVSGGLLPSDELRLQIGYLQGAVASSGAVYSVQFAPTGGTQVTIASLTVDPGGALNVITLPLSGVQAGQQGEFILRVERGTVPAAETAVWVLARVVRPR